MFRKTAIERNAVLTTENVSLSELEERIESSSESQETQKQEDDEENNNNVY